ncbi:MAG: hypothetical protein FJZ00_12080, partial [Candidatus Sericytochromatia bacterium]|nr:hypothetical protein [Candidatus Tanganyikabacteria bacterium]
LDDKITGSGPTDIEERKAWLTKYQPYSIKVGDTWVGYQKLAPWGITVGAMADTAEAMKAKHDPGKEAGEMAIKGIASVVENINRQTFIQGLIGVANVAQDPARYGEKLLGQLAGGFVPFSGLTASVARLGDNTIHAPSNIGERIAARIPWVSGAVPPSRDITGEPVQRGGGPIIGAFSPVPFKVEPDDAALDAAVEAGVRHSRPKDKITIRDQVLEVPSWERDKIESQILQTTWIMWQRREASLASMSQEKRLELYRDLHERATKHVMRDYRAKRSRELIAQ